MGRNLLSVAALLFGTLFLFMGNGLQGLLLPVRGNIEGYETTTLGLLGTSWATGFVIGCLVAPKIVRRVGHVRAFSGFIAIIAVIALGSGIVIDPFWWVLLRAVTGFSTAGTSMIIESWLNERASNESRGAIFSLYIGITLLGVVGGQMMIPLEDVRTPVLFMVCGIFYCIAMLPTTLSTAASPQPLKAVKLDLPALYRNSPVSCLGILLVGIANGAYGTLGAVFGAGAGLPDAAIAIMMSATIFAGAVMQLPAGRLSDRIDRRYVLAGMSAIAALAGLLIFLLHPASPVFLIGLVILYGAVANTLYPIAVAHANDFAAAEDFVKVSGGLLLLYGIGTIIGPTIGGPVMSAVGPHALFLVTAFAHLLVTAYAIVRSRIRAAVPAGDRDAFTTIPTATSATLTPESMSLADPAANKSPDSVDPAVKFG
jgi:MFS family permease